MQWLLLCPPLRWSWGAPSSPSLRLVSRILRSAFGPPCPPESLNRWVGGARSRPLSSDAVLTYPAATGHASLFVRHFKGNTSPRVSWFPLRLLCPQPSLSHWRAAPSFSCCASCLEVIRDLSFSPPPHLVVSGKPIVSYLQSVARAVSLLIPSAVATLVQTFCLPYRGCLLTVLLASDLAPSRLFST